MEDEIKKSSTVEEFYRIAAICSTLNHKLLRSIDHLVMDFIGDAIIDYEISAKDMIRLIQYSRIDASARSERPLSDQRIWKIETKKEGASKDDCELFGGSAMLQKVPKIIFSVAAANLITILNYLKFDFSNMDLRAVKISGADLQEGVFDSVDFTGADLSGVNFQRTSLNNVNFTKANMSVIEFGEWPAFELNESIGCTACSTNGRFIAAGVIFEQVILERDSINVLLKEFRRFQGHTSAINSCTFSPDCKLVASSETSFYNVRVWDLAQGLCLRSIVRDSGKIRSCLFSPNGKQLALTGNKQENIYIWDVKTEKDPLMVRIPLHLSITVVNGAGFSQDSKSLFVHIDSLDKSMVIVWDIERKRWTRSLGNQAAPAVECSFCPDETQMVTVRNCDTALVWNLRTGNIIQIFKIVPQFLSGLEFSPDGKRIALRCLDSSIRVWNMLVKDYTHVFKITLPKLAHGLGSFTFSFDACQLVSGSIFGTIHLWDVSRVEDYGSNKYLNLSNINIQTVCGLRDGHKKLFYQKRQCLELRENEFRDLILNPDVEQITKIDLSRTVMTNHGAAEIGSNQTWYNLQELYLSSNNHPSCDARPIFANRVWTELKILSLTGIKLHPADIEGLKQHNPWKKLEVISLNQCEITNKSCSALASIMDWGSLKVLSLKANCILDYGAAALAASTSLRTLEELYLDQNRIGDEGAIALGNNSSWKNLRVLSLKTNAISDLGAKGLAKNSTWIALDTLCLKKNRIAEAGIRAIAENACWLTLKTVSFQGNAGIMRDAERLLKQNPLFGSQLRCEFI